MPKEWSSSRFEPVLEVAKESVARDCQLRSNSHIVLALDVGRDVESKARVEKIGAPRDSIPSSKQQLLLVVKRKVEAYAA